LFAALGLDTVGTMCVACEIVREFACRADPVSCGLYFAFDLGGALYGLQVTGRARALVRVHVPLKFGIPFADGSRVLYALFGFVELKRGQAVGCAQIGPAHFIGYDDLAGSATDSPGSLCSVVQLSGDMSLAPYCMIWD
jgi:hypothetical protein